MPEPDNLRTFFKSVRRVLPSYYLCLLLYLIFWVRPSDYANVNNHLQDIFAHLTFTQTFWRKATSAAKFPTALWTRRGNAVLASSFARARSVNACVLGGALRFGAGVYRAHLQGNAGACASTSSRRFWVYMEAVCCVRSSSAACRYGASANGRRPYFTACGAVPCFISAVLPVVCMLGSGACAVGNHPALAGGLPLSIAAMVCVSFAFGCCAKGVQ